MALVIHRASRGRPKTDDAVLARTTGVISGLDSRDSFTVIQFTGNAPLSPAQIDVVKRRYQGRAVQWGAGICGGPDTTDPNHILPAKNGPKQESIQVGIFAACGTAWTNPTAGVVIAFPRHTNSSSTQQYRNVAGEPSKQLTVNLQLPNRCFTVQAKKLAADRYQVHINLDPATKLQVSGHPWPYNPANDHLKDFFLGAAWDAATASFRDDVPPRVMTLAWIAAQNIVNLVLPEAGLRLLLDYMQVMATVEDQDIFARYRLPERKWDYSVLAHRFGDPVADAFYAKQQFPPKLRFDNIHQYVDIQLAATIKESLFVEMRAKELRNTRLHAQFYLMSAPGEHASASCWVVIDTGGIDLSQHFNGVLDAYLKPGQDIKLSFWAGTSEPWNSKKAKQTDSMGHTACKVALPSPGRTSRRDLVFLKGQVADMLPDRVMESQFGYWQDFAIPGREQPASIAVWLKLADTTKQARRQVNGLVRLWPNGPRGDGETRDCDDSECDESWPIIDPKTKGATRGRLLADVLCANSIANYMEVDLLAKVPVVLQQRILAAIADDDRQGTIDALSGVPAGMYLITGAPGCGKSVKLAVVGTLCIFNKWHGILVATQHKAIDACLAKIINLWRSIGEHEVVAVRTYTQATDMLACQRVVSGRNWKSGAYSVKCNFEPKFSIAEWLSCYVSGDCHPLTGRPLEATDPRLNQACFSDLKSTMWLCEHPPQGMSVKEFCELRGQRTRQLKAAMKAILVEADLICATPYAALENHVKASVEDTDFVLIDEAATMPEASLMQVTFPQQKFIGMAFDHKQLPVHSDAKNQIGEPRINLFEEQYVKSLAQRLTQAGWPVDVQTRQVRMLPGLMAPIREVFYRGEGIHDVHLPGRDTSIGVTVENWLCELGFPRPSTISTLAYNQRAANSTFVSPPAGTFSPAFLHVAGTTINMAPQSSSSINQGMWDRVFPLLRQAFFDENATHRIDHDKIVVIIPYSAGVAYVTESFRAAGFNAVPQVVDTDEGDDGTLPSIHDPWVPSHPNVSRDDILKNIPDRPVGDGDDPDGPVIEDMKKRTPIVPYHRPGGIPGIVVTTIDAFQGQEGELAIFVSMVTAESGPKCLANKLRLNVAMSRMRQALLVVGDMRAAYYVPPKTKLNKAASYVDEDGRRLQTKEFKDVWAWFRKNRRMITLPSAPPTAPVRVTGARPVKHTKKEYDPAPSASDAVGDGKTKTPLPCGSDWF